MSDGINRRNGIVGVCFVMKENAFRLLQHCTALGTIRHFIILLILLQNCSNHIPRGNEPNFPSRELRLDFLGWKRCVPLLWRLAFGTLVTQTGFVPCGEMWQKVFTSKRLWKCAHKSSCAHQSASRHPPKTTQNTLEALWQWYVHIWYWNPIPSPELLKKCNCSHKSWH